MREKDIWGTVDEIANWVWRRTTAVLLHVRKHHTIDKLDRSALCSLVRTAAITRWYHEICVTSHYMYYIRQTLDSNHDRIPGRDRDCQDYYHHIEQDEQKVRENAAVRKHRVSL